jgi:hypothetical protein
MWSLKASPPAWGRFAIAMQAHHMIPGLGTRVNRTDVTGAALPAPAQDAATVSRRTAGCFKFEC